MNGPLLHNAVYNDLNSGITRPNSAAAYSDHLQEAGHPGAHMYGALASTGRATIPKKAGWTDAPADKEHKQNWFGIVHPEGNQLHLAHRGPVHTQDNPSQISFGVNVKSKEHARHLLSDAPEPVRQHMEQHFIPHLPDEPARMYRMQSAFVK
jgi:hypothetical protein